MENVDLTRCLTMGAYSGLRALGDCLADHVGLSEEQAIALIRRTNADVASLDFVGAIEAASIIGRRFDPYNEPPSLEEFIKIILQERWPWWLRVFPLGRDRVISMLSTDQKQCFRSASLLDPLPSETVIAWWDEMNAFVRQHEELGTMLQAREAERLSFERERERLRDLGVEFDPLWVSLEDNTVGYDILSYDLQGGALVNRLVEVKSTSSGSIYVTRNEWNNAATAGSNYFFHIWKFPSRAFQEFAGLTISKCIPQDRGTGAWQNVKIDIDE